MNELKIGIKGEIEEKVTAEKLAVNVGSGEVSVFATPMMIAGIEGTAAGSVKPYLAEGATTVGMEISMTHVAATAVGKTVRFETELTEIAPNGRIFTFQVAAYDEAGLIGEGMHKRCVVDKARFEEKAKTR